MGPRYLPPFPSLRKTISAPLRVRLAKCLTCFSRLSVKTNSGSMGCFPCKPNANHGFCEHFLWPIASAAADLNLCNRVRLVGILSAACNDCGQMDCRMILALYLRLMGNLLSRRKRKIPLWTRSWCCLTERRKEYRISAPKSTPEYKLFGEKKTTTGPTKALHGDTSHHFSSCFSPNLPEDLGSGQGALCQIEFKKQKIESAPGDSTWPLLNPRFGGHFEFEQVT